MTFDEWWSSRTFEGTKRTIAEEAWEAGREELLTRLEQAEPKEDEWVPIYDRLWGF